MIVFRYKNKHTGEFFRYRDTSVWENPVRAMVDFINLNKNHSDYTKDEFFDIWLEEYEEFKYRVEEIKEI